MNFQLHFTLEGICNNSDDVSDDAHDTKHIEVVFTLVKYIYFCKIYLFKNCLC